VNLNCVLAQAIDSKKGQPRGYQFGGFGLASWIASARKLRLYLHHSGQNDELPDMNKRPSDRHQQSPHRESEGKRFRFEA
jgi:hypothetical protein